MTLTVILTMCDQTEVAQIRRLPNSSEKLADSCVKGMMIDKWVYSYDQVEARYPYDAPSIRETNDHS